MLLFTNENHTATLRSGIFDHLACAVYGTLGDTWWQNYKKFSNFAPLGRIFSTTHSKFF